MIIRRKTNARVPTVRYDSEQAKEIHRYFFRFVEGDISSGFFEYQLKLVFKENPKILLLPSKNDHSILMDALHLPFGNKATKLCASQREAIEKSGEVMEMLGNLFVDSAVNGKGKFAYATRSEQAKKLFLGTDSAGYNPLSQLCKNGNKTLLIQYLSYLQPLIDVQIVTEKDLAILFNQQTTWGDTPFHFVSKELHRLELYTVLIDFLKVNLAQPKLFIERLLKKENANHLMPFLPEEGYENLNHGTPNLVWIDDSDDDEASASDDQVPEEETAFSSPLEVSQDAGVAESEPVDTSETNIKSSANKEETPLENEPKPKAPSDETSSSRLNDENQSRSSLTSSTSSNDSISHASNPINDKTNALTKRTKHKKKSKKKNSSTTTMESSSDNSEKNKGSNPKTSSDSPKSEVENNKKLAANDSNQIVFSDEEKNCCKRVTKTMFGLFSKLTSQLRYSQKNVEASGALRKAEKSM